MKFSCKFSPEKEQFLNDVGLLLGRIGFGFFMAFGHGLTKLQNFGEMSAKFPDPLGVGSPVSMGLAIFAEFLCSFLIMLGLFTRFASLNLIITMAVAAFLVHAKDPLFASGQASKEFALIYLIGYVILFFTGAGRFSVDRILANRCQKKSAAKK